MVDISVRLLALNVVVLEVGLKKSRWKSTACESQAITAI